MIGLPSVTALPDPGAANDLDGLVTRLRQLKVIAGNPSFTAVTKSINQAWARAGRTPSELTKRSTVVGYFTYGRKRLNEDLLLAIVRVLSPHETYAGDWRMAIRAIAGQAMDTVTADCRRGLPNVPSCVGHADELDRLTELAGHYPVMTIDGMAGVGKTHLAVHAARTLVDSGRFDDVQLFADLRGFDPHLPPAKPTAVLGQFLRLLGVRAGDIPDSPDGRVAMYRSLSRDRRALIVLDNAADEASVAPLLPGGNTCLTLVTSRRVLDLRSATRLRLDVLSPDAALNFLDPASVHAEPEVAGRLVELCGRLPLALALTAAYLRDHPEISLPDHTQHCAEGRPHDEVFASLELSYRALPAADRAVFRLLGLHPGQDLALSAAAALADLDLDAAERCLATLSRASLLNQTDASRYELHCLVRAYARAKALREDPPSRRKAAVARLLNVPVG